MKTEWEKYLGLAIRAGAVVYGIDKILQNKNIYLVLIDYTATENLQAKVLNFVKKNNIPKIDLDNKIDEIIKSNNCKVIGITNENLAKQIKSIIFKE